METCGEGDRKCRRYSGIDFAQTYRLVFGFGGAWDTRVTPHLSSTHSLVNKRAGHGQQGLWAPVARRACGRLRSWSRSRPTASSRVSTSMSRKHRSNKRRRSQAFPDEEEHVVEPVPAAEPEEPAPPEVVEVVEVAEPEPEQVNAPAEEQNEEPQLPEESPEELKRKQEIWETFQEEHHEGAFSVSPVPAARADSRLQSSSSCRYPCRGHTRSSRSWTSR